MPKERKSLKSIFLAVLASIYFKNLKKSKWLLIKNTISATNAIKDCNATNPTFDKQMEKRKMESILRNMEIKDYLFELSLLEYKTEFLVRNYTELNRKIDYQKYRCDQVLNKL